MIMKIQCFNSIIKYYDSLDIANQEVKLIIQLDYLKMPMSYCNIKHNVSILHVSATFMYVI